MKCVYCLNEGDETLFKGSEHVIPAFLGGTRHMMLNKLVCDSCNSKFSSIETKFKENSLEGVFTSMIRLKNNRTIRLHDDFLKYRLSCTAGDLGFFAKQFPTIKADGKIYFMAQVHLKNKVNDKYEVIFAQALVNPNKKFREQFFKYSNKDILIFADLEYPLDRIIALLKGVNINYQQKELHVPNMNLKPSGQILINWDVRIDNSLLRLPAKISFNYLLFCALKSGLIDRFYGSSFNEIRSYILDGIQPADKSKIITLVDKPVYHTTNTDLQSFACIHVLTLEYNNGYIWGNITLFNQFKYRIRLGKYTFNFAPPAKFGCATALNPFTGQFEKLYPSVRNDMSFITNLDSQQFSLFSR